ncbi:MAG: PulJ/GspJ family protein [Chloroflexota bacterium]
MMGNQSGMTLVESLIAIAISGLIASALGTAVFQLVTFSERGTDEMTAVHNIQNAARWVSRDCQEASNATLGDGGELYLTLPGNSTVNYFLSGTELRRESNSSQISVSRNVGNVNFDVDGRVVTMTLTVSPQGRWEISRERTYKVYLRPTN